MSYQDKPEMPTGPTPLDVCPECGSEVVVLGSKLAPHHDVNQLPDLVVCAGE